MFRSVLFLSLVTLLSGALAKETSPREPVKKPGAILALKLVHPENESLIRAIKAGRKEVPADYLVVPMDLIDVETGEKVGEEGILLHQEDIVTAEFVKKARPTGQPGEVIVKLTEIGGKKLEAATKKMKLGVDRMAVVFEGRVVVAPTVQAVLTDTFVINGLGGRDEVRRVVQVLNTKAKN